MVGNATVKPKKVKGNTPRPSTAAEKTLAQFAKWIFIGRIACSLEPFLGYSAIPSIPISSHNCCNLIGQNSNSLVSNTQYPTKVNLSLSN